MPLPRQSLRQRLSQAEKGYAFDDIGFNTGPPRDVDFWLFADSRRWKVGVEEMVVSREHFLMLAVRCSPPPHSPLIIQPQARTVPAHFGQATG